MIRERSSQRALPTGVGDARAVSPAEREDELSGKLSHERHGNVCGSEIEMESFQGLAHELEYEAGVCSIGARMLKIVNKVADVLAAFVVDPRVHAGLGAEANENVALRDTIS